MDRARRRPPPRPQPGPSDSPPPPATARPEPLLRRRTTGGARPPLVGRRPYGAVTIATGTGTVSVSVTETVNETATGPIATGTLRRTATGQCPPSARRVAIRGRSALRTVDRDPAAAVATTVVPLGLHLGAVRAGESPRRGPLRVGPARGHARPIGTGPAQAAAAVPARRPPRARRRAITHPLLLRLHEEPPPLLPRARMPTPRCPTVGAEAPPSLRSTRPTGAGEVPAVRRRRRNSTRRGVEPSLGVQGARRARVTRGKSLAVVPRGLRVGVGG